MSRVFWLGMRHAEAIREALVTTLGLNLYGYPSEEQWLKEQGIQGVPEGEPLGRVIRDVLTMKFTERVGTHPEMLIRWIDAPDRGIGDRGEERAGAGWSTAPNFVITSAFVRLLGALEQFEIDTLKALFYYRPAGLLGNAADSIEVEVEHDVLFEEPVVENNKKIFAKPILWTWIRTYAENNEERRKILKNIFNITTIPEPFESKQKVEWYDKRNAIAHGRAGVTMTILEYSDVDVFVAKSMMFIRDQCQDSLKVLL